ISTSRASPASRSSVALIEPSSEFSIGTIAQATSPSRRAAIVSRMLARGCGSIASGAALASRASSLKVPSGPRYATPGRRAISGRWPGRVPRHAIDAAARDREPHRFRLLGRELELAAPAAHLLAVDARLVAVVDARQHDPRLLVVE